MSLRVREIFGPTLQGEGSRAGSPAVFVRFSGCNLWSGLEKHRGEGKGECSRWCDTDFAKGTNLTAMEIIESVCKISQPLLRAPFVVLSGGEPMLQLGRPEGLDLLHGLKLRGFTLAVETNGTIEIPGFVLTHLDHVTVSPKPLMAGATSLTTIDHIRQRSGDDLKVIVPTPFSDEDLHRLAVGFTHRFVQPMDPAALRWTTGTSTTPPEGGESDPLYWLDEAVGMASRLGWRVSLQTHKLAGLP